MNFKLSQDKWKIIEDFPDYSISTSGRVKRNNNINKLGRIIKTNCLSPSYSTGYAVVILMKDGKKYYKKVHRLVAKAFIPNPNNLPCVNHKDENKKNNNISNLEWCTKSYNNTYNSRAKKVGEKERKYVSIYSIENGIETFLKTVKITDVKKFNISIHAVYKNIDTDKAFYVRKNNKYYKIKSYDNTTSV